nr:hypothetical protein BaRGS_030512 [Batillaria attramentaria]
MRGAALWRRAPPRRRNPNFQHRREGDGQAPAPLDFQTEYYKITALMFNEQIKAFKCLANLWFKDPSPPIPGMDPTPVTTTASPIPQVTEKGRCPLDQGQPDQCRLGQSQPDQCRLGQSQLDQGNKGNGTFRPNCS